MASRSRRPCLRSSAKATWSKRSTSRETSWWIASAVFFPVPLGVLDGTKATDFFVDLDEVTAEFLVLAELADFALGFANRSGAGWGFGDGLAGGFVGEPESGTVARIAGSSAMASWLAAAAYDARDATGPEILKRGDIGDQAGAIEFEIGNGLGHERLFFF
jgi:hypothetical protein